MAVVGYVEILVAALCFLLVRHWRLHRNTVITVWPVVGMLPDILRNVPRMHEYIDEVIKRGGGTIEIKGPWLTNLDFLGTNDPLNVRHIFNQSFEKYPKGPEFKIIFEPLGDGIFNSDSDLWKDQRKMFQLLTGQTKFVTYMEKTIQRKVINGLLPVLDHVSTTQIQVDLQDVFQRLTFDNICLLVLGFDPLCLSIDFPKVEHEKALDEIEEIFFHRHVIPEIWWKLQKWLQIGKEKNLPRAVKVLDDFIYKCISLKRREITSRNSRIKEETDFDLLTSYIEEEEKQKQMGCFTDSDKFLRDTALNLMVAGRDTIGATLTWFFWLVSKHPCVETKILEEMKEKLQVVKHEDDDHIISLGAEEVRKLVYLHAALCETLRLYPPVPINHKCPTQADTLPSGHHIKANQRILFSFYSMGRREEIWGKDCSEFKPERWISDDGGIVYVPSYKFTAFNTGPRTCLGKDMGFIQMKMIAASILWNYQVKAVEEHPVIPNTSIILYMQHGLKVRVSKRCAAVGSQIKG
ncbi:alkane hydroxylase MAH1-like [Ziziphus jujuba]|uniref:Alkane hydroxylase MAH1-like n=1 Tax=Ziziphus jujuba TaxID=326968 RepID=A0A6P3YR21_ZIZJJ|nr:alkane hydroxylase MAH1-like [Ziziphus jujuba]